MSSSRHKSVLRQSVRQQLHFRCEFEIRFLCTKKRICKGTVFKLRKLWDPVFYNIGFLVFLVE